MLASRSRRNGASLPGVLPVPIHFHRMVASAPARPIPGRLRAAPPVALVAQLRWRTRVPAASDLSAILASAITRAVSTGADFHLGTHLHGSERHCLAALGKLHHGHAGFVDNRRPLVPALGLQRGTIERGDRRHAGGELNPSRPSGPSNFTFSAFSGNGTGFALSATSAAAHPRGWRLARPAGFVGGDHLFGYRRRIGEEPRVGFLFRLARAASADSFICVTRLTKVRSYWWPSLSVAH